jgi:hypothetical protein
VPLLNMVHALLDFLQSRYYHGFGFHAGGLSCGVEGAFFGQAVIPVPASFEQQKRPSHGPSRFTLLSQASVKPGATKRP